MSFDSQTIIQFIFTPNFSGQLWFLMVIKIIFILVSVFMIGMIIYVLATTSYLKRIWLWGAKEVLTFRGYATSHLEGRWRKIISKLNSNLASDYKLAIIDADLMLEEVLKKMGYVGTNLTEILLTITDEILPNLEDIRKAHQIYLNIINDPSYNLELEETKNIISAYQKSFEQLQVI